MDAIAAEAVAWAASFAAIVLATLVAAGVRRARDAARDGRLGHGRAFGIELVAWGGAAGLLADLLARPAAGLPAAASDPRGLAFAALAGAALARLSPDARAAAVAGVSLALVGRIAGPAALATNLAACLPAYALVRHVAPKRRGIAAALQLALFGALLLLLARLRLSDPMAALAAWGLLVFTGMRHASFARSVRDGPPETLGRYLSYLVFYPSCVGAMEPYAGFRARNLDAPPPFAPFEALYRIAVGTLAFAIALRIDASMDRVLAAHGVLAVWTEVMRLLVRAALAVSGLWGTLEGGALLLGFRLLPNFRGILLASSPSQFWHAWRATMTRWLVVHVYVPLGGNQRHRTRNIAAAFAVSTVWHCAGVAMLQGEHLAVAALAPVVTWGVVSFAGVALHAAARARWKPKERPPLAALPLRALKIGGTWIYASATVTLLDLSLASPERFLLFVRRIAGLP